MTSDSTTEKRRKRKNEKRNIAFLYWEKISRNKKISRNLQTVEEVVDAGRGT